MANFGLSGWWAGARLHSRGVDLHSMAERAGGYAALVAGGQEALVAGGVEPERARRWSTTAAQELPWRALTLADEDYPRLLRGIPGAPPVLEVQGSVSALTAPAVAVVGTRSCSSYGVAVARHVGHALASAGVSVVSGLARGIDGHAHRAALAAGRTVAVLGHGLDHTAPAGHRRLRAEIVDSGGAVVSSWARQVEPRPWRFPVRNQWVAGLSEAVVVVEAPLRSGALITACRAAEMARDVVVVPGRLGDVASRGCLRLLAEGAEPIEDVEEWVSQRFGGERHRREAWLELLFEGRTVTEVAERVGSTGPEMLRELGRRELAGEVVRLPGQRYGPGGRSRCPGDQGSEAPVPGC